MAAGRQTQTTYLRPEPASAAPAEVQPRPLPLGWLWLPASALVLVAAWALLVRLAGYPPYLLPGPGAVATRFVSAVSDGTWWWHTRVTLVESLLGFALGFTVAVTAGYLLSRSRLLERTLGPYVAASQSLPVVAIAPLVVLWFGYGLFPKVLVGALVVFFPILVNTLVGIRNVPRELREVAQVYGASRLQTLWMVELPLALPVLLAGVRMGITLSTTGAVVAEFVGADTGLGVLLNISKGMFDTPLMFVALITLVAMASTFYALATLFDHWLINRMER